MPTAAGGGAIRWFGVMCAVAYGLPTLFYPHGNDQALHWYVAQGWLRGELPFESAISGKPIGIFAVHALATLLFGSDQAAIRLLELLSLLVGAELLALLVRERGAPARAGDVGLAAIAIVGLYYTYFDYWDSAHPEIWEALCILGAAAVAMHDSRPVRRALACGALCALACMFKYPAAVLALPVAGCVAARAVAAGQEQTARPVAGLLAVLSAAAWFLLGAGAVVLTCVLPFVLGGAWGPMWEVLVTFTARYVEQAGWGGGLPRWVRFSYGASALLVAAVALAIGVYLLHRRGASRDARARAGLLAALTVAALASVWLQNRFFSYHFAVVAPFLAGCVVFGVRTVVAGNLRRATALSLALLAAAFLAAPRWCSNPGFSYRAHVLLLADHLGGRVDRQKYLEPFTGLSALDRYAQLEHIGLYLRELASPGDSMCARGFAPPLYQVSGLRCPSRHVVESWSAALPAWNREFFQTMREHPATFVVTFDDRPDEIRRLRRLGYQKSDLPDLFVLMTHTERSLRSGERMAKRGR